MMNLNRRLTAAFTIGNVAIVLGLGVAAIVWSWGLLEVPRSNLEGASPLGVRVLVSAIALAAAVADIGFLYIRYLSRYDAFLKVKTAEGIVQVAIPAIEQSLARTARSLPEVSDARVRVYRDGGDGGPVVARVNYAAWDGTSVREVSQKVQQVLAMRFEQICGGDIVPRFQVYLTRIDMKEVRKVGGAKAGEGGSGEPVDLFRGPVYPTGDEL